MLQSTVFAFRLLSYYNEVQIAKPRLHWWQALHTNNIRKQVKAFSANEEKGSYPTLNLERDKHCIIKNEHLLCKNAYQENFRVASQNEQVRIQGLTH